MAKERPIKVPRSKMLETPEGFMPQGPGWYILNAKDSVWHQSEKFGATCGFEGTERFKEFGINLHIIYPGQPNCHYHGGR